MSLSCSFVHASVARRILRHESGANSFYMCHLPRILVLILVMGGGRIRSHQILSSITCLISYFPLAAWPCSWLDLELIYHPEEYRLICFTKGRISFLCAIVWCFYTKIKHKKLAVFESSPSESSRLLMWSLVLSNAQFGYKTLQ
jgi:hypothetical protein